MINQEFKHLIIQGPLKARTFNIFDCFTNNKEQFCTWIKQGSKATQWNAILLQLHGNLLFGKETTRDQVYNQNSAKSKKHQLKSQLMGLRYLFKSGEKTLFL